MEYPRILISGPAFESHTGGGITLCNLFSGWQKDRIAAACTNYHLNGLDLDICDTYYRLGTKEVKWSFPFTRFQRKYASGLVDFSSYEDPKPSNGVPGRRSIRSVLLNDYLFPMLDYMGFTHVAYRIRMSDDFRAWLKEYDPEIIYVQISSLQQIRFALDVCEFLKVPMVLHIMDDWPAYISNHGLLRKFWRKRIDREFQILVDRSALHLSISEDMSVAYAQRYGGEFVPFHNPIELERWENAARTDYDLSNPVRILYAGRTGIGIDRTLEVAARGVKQLNDTGHVKTTLVIQSKEPPKWIGKYDCVEFQPFVNYEELPGVFAGADFLLIPYDFSRREVELFRYSMPTKITEYMACGTPVIIFAPAGTAISHYAGKHGVAALVTEEDPRAFSTKLKELIENHSLRKEMAGKAMELAHTNHEASKVRVQFRESIRSVLKKKAENS